MEKNFITVQRLTEEDAQILSLFAELFFNVRVSKSDNKYIMAVNYMDEIRPELWDLCEKIGLQPFWIEESEDFYFENPNVTVWSGDLFDQILDYLENR